VLRAGVVNDILVLLASMLTNNLQQRKLPMNSRQTDTRLTASFPGQPG